MTRTDLAVVSDWLGRWASRECPHWNGAWMKTVFGRLNGMSLHVPPSRSPKAEPKGERSLHSTGVGLGNGGVDFPRHRALLWVVVLRHSEGVDFDHEEREEHEEGRGKDTLMFHESC